MKHHNKQIIMCSYGRAYANVGRAAASVVVHVARQSSYVTIILFVFAAEVFTSGTRFFSSDRPPKMMRVMRTRNTRSRMCEYVYCNNGVCFCVFCRPCSCRSWRTLGRERKRTKIVASPPPRSRRGTYDCGSYYCTRGG